MKPLNNQQIFARVKKISASSVLQLTFKPDELTVNFHKTDRTNRLGFIVFIEESRWVLALADALPIMVEYRPSDTIETIAADIIATIKLLASGQLSVLESKRSGQSYAYEAVLEFADGARRVIATEADMSGIKKATPAELTVIRLSNQAPLKPHVFGDDFVLFAKGADGLYPVHGRPLQPSTDTPLLPVEFDKYFEKSLWNGTGLQETKLDWKVMYRQWEFWLLGTLFIGAYIVLDSFKLLPGFVSEHPIILAPVVVLSITLLMPHILRRKLTRKQRHEA